MGYPIVIIRLEIKRTDMLLRDFVYYGVLGVPKPRNVQVFTRDVMGSSTSVETLIPLVLTLYLTLRNLWTPKNQRDGIGVHGHLTPTIRI